MDILAVNIPVCGNCVNCRFQVWLEPDKPDKFRSLNHIRDSATKTNVYFVLNCTWLKQAIFEPQNMFFCQGKREADSED